VKIIIRVVVSLAIKIEAVVLAKRAFGSVHRWTCNCRMMHDPTERNRRVLDAVYRIYPEFRHQLDWPARG
jgi:hypothetical protein